MARELTPKQEAFCIAFVETDNATEAYRRAYRAENMKASTIAVKASELLSNGKITVRLESLRKPALHKAQVTVDRVVVELARIAFGDKRKVVTWGQGGIEIKDSDSLSDDDAAMVSEVSEEDTKFGTRRKVKVHDKLKALELLGKHLGMFKDAAPGDDDDVPPPTKVEIVVRDARK